MLTHAKVTLRPSYYPVHQLFLQGKMLLNFDPGFCEGAKSADHQTAQAVRR
jgi:hypothetical protein